MTLPSSDDLKAKLSKDVNNSDHTRLLDNLKSSLKLVYHSVKKANRKSHLNNNILCDRKAKLRSSEIGELYNPAKKNQFTELKVRSSDHNARTAGYELAGENSNTGSPRANTRRKGQLKYEERKLRFICK